MGVKVSSFWSVLNPFPAWKKELQGYNSRSFQQDLLSGLTVGVVALPLALAFGVTSGAGATAGLITAIIAGILASVFGGSRYQITGPTGAMTVVLIPVIAQFGLEKVFVVGLMAGVLLLLFGLLRIGRMVNLIPWPVITGFTNGIAVIIFLQQLPSFLGLKATSGESILRSSAEVLQRFAQSPQWTPVGLTALTVAIVLVWPRVSKKIPGSIVALLVVTGLSLILQLDVPRIGAIPSSLPSPTLPQMQWSDLNVLFSAALAVAVLSALESLLSAVVADGMTLKDHHDPDRELIGQGIAMFAAPFFGGIPSTGAIARTAVNVRSGGQTRMVGVIHALFLLVVVLFLGKYASVIPLAVLGGILMVTAYRMLEFEAIRSLARSTKSDFVTMLVTTIITIAFDLILAIEIGLAVAGVLFIQRMIRSLSLEPIDVVQNTPSNPNIDPHLLQKRVLAYRVDGPLFFGVAGWFIENLTSYTDIDVIILRMRRVKTLDASGAHALEAIWHELKGRGITLLFSGVQKQPLDLLEKMGLLEDLGMQGKHIFENTDQAIEHAWSHVHRKHLASPHEANS
ncbi:SulP family inorganic anion transporter [Deinococcus cellulosilyticus]|uniref:Sulfate permease n=1 Tax=Deinococcus cellulosilyticus (strain DSM 18568 / NBRC 106333 / KACC 11606 / 5516J-15) TaxID=1223518 RepID=A0A511N7D0_DEIC1|nr:SulP family inorganic anion transporter [Deinococcus cellulosilyticus]GEM48753.1 sulfate permease [Deinococcus cellulosilyticus NBRC 106333 = KACC 11606]